MATACYHSAARRLPPPATCQEPGLEQQLPRIYTNVKSAETRLPSVTLLSVIESVAPSLITTSAPTCVEADWTCEKVPKSFAANRIASWFEPIPPVKSSNLTSPKLPLNSNRSEAPA